MKIRYGFVTNSSSSSFILNFKSKHTMREELEEEHMVPDLIDFLVNMIEDEGQQLSKAEYTKMVTEELEDVYRFDQYMHRSNRGMKDARWSDPLEGQYAERYQKRLAELMTAIPDGSFTVVIDVEDHTDMGSDLEHYVLPNAKHTVAYFSHH